MTIALAILLGWIIVGLIVTYRFFNYIAPKREDKFEA